MINLAELGRMFIVCGKTNMRRGIDSLAYIVKKSFHFDPFSGCVFLFCGSRKDRFKALYWDSGCSISALRIESLNKGGANWAYAWVPVLGPIAGGLLASGLQAWLK